MARTQGITSPLLEECHVVTDDHKWSGASVNRSNPDSNEVNGNFDTVFSGGRNWSCILSEKCHFQFHSPPQHRVGYRVNHHVGYSLHIDSEKVFHQLNHEHHVLSSNVPNTYTDQAKSCINRDLTRSQSKAVELQTSHPVLTHFLFLLHSTNTL